MAVLGGTVLLIVSDRLPPNAAPMVALLVANGVITTSLWFTTLWLAAQGRATWFAGVALPANAVACVMLAMPWTTLSVRVIAMLVGLTLGNALLWLYFRIRRLGPRQEQLPIGSGSARATVTWFFAKSATGHVGLNAIQALALVLPASSITILSILTKVVGSISTTAINALMPTLVNANQSSQEPALRFLWRTSVPLSMFLVVVSTIALVKTNVSVAYVAIGLGWLAAINANAVAQRLAYRFLPPSASRVSILVMLVVLASLGTMAAFDALSLPLLVIGFVTIEAATAITLLWVLNVRNSTGLVLLTWGLTMTIGIAI
jgi:hypothetical protein